MWRNLIVVTAIMCVIMIAIMCNEYLYQLIGHRIMYTIQGLLGLEGDRSTNERLFMMEYAMNMFKQKPIFGWGSNSFVTEMRRIEHTHVAYSHNNYTELLATLGIVGFVLFYFMQAKVLIQGVKKLIREHSLEIVFAVSLVAVNMFGEFFYVSLYSTFTQILIALMYLIIRGKHKPSA